MKIKVVAYSRKERRKRYRIKYAEKRKEKKLNKQNMTSYDSSGMPVRDDSSGAAFAGYQTGSPFSSSSSDGLAVYSPLDYGISSGGVLDVILDSPILELAPVVMPLRPDSPASNISDTPFTGAAGLKYFDAQSPNNVQSSSTSSGISITTILIAITFLFILLKKSR